LWRCKENGNGCMKQKLKELYGFAFMMWLSFIGLFQGGIPIIEAIEVTLAAWASVFTVIYSLQIYRKMKS